MTEGGQLVTLSNIIILRVLKLIYTELGGMGVSGNCQIKEMPLRKRKRAVYPRPGVLLSVCYANLTSHSPLLHLFLLGGRHHHPYMHVFIICPELADILTI